jgi:hypothetical protein
MVDLVMFDQFYSAVLAPIVVAQNANSRRVDWEPENGREGNMEIMVFVENWKENRNFTLRPIDRDGGRPSSKSPGKVMKFERCEYSEWKNDEQAN